MSDINLWLQSLGLEKYGEVLASHDIDLTVVPHLTEQDLEKLGLSLGHRRKFIAAAAKLRAVTTSPAVASVQGDPPLQPVPAVERRQVTIVFIDLAGSTAFGRDLDPETSSACCGNTATPASLRSANTMDLSRNTWVMAYSCISAFHKHRSTRPSAQCEPVWKSWRKSDG